MTKTARSTALMQIARRDSRARTKHRRDGLQSRSNKAWVHLLHRCLATVAWRLNRFSWDRQDPRNVRHARAERSQETRATRRDLAVLSVRTIAATGNKIGRTTSLQVTAPNPTSVSRSTCRVALQAPHRLDKPAVAHHRQATFRTRTPGLAGRRRVRSKRALVDALPAPFARRNPRERRVYASAKMA